MHITSECVDHLIISTVVYVFYILMVLPLTYILNLFYRLKGGNHHTMKSGAGGNSWQQGSGGGGGRSFGNGGSGVAQRGGGGAYGNRNSSGVSAGLGSRSNR